MKAIIIRNPAAGPHAVAQHAELEVSEAIRFLQNQGIEILATKTTMGPGDATTFAREAVAQACEIVFVAGGDGTLAQAVDGLVGTDTALGVLPAGTGNVFARQLNMPTAGPLHPKPLLEATRSLVAGEIRRVDVGRMTLRGGVSRHFLSWGGVGFDAMVNRVVNADPARKRQFGLAAFVTAAFMTLRDLAGTATRLRFDDRRVSRRLLMLVANNIQLYGVVFKMAEHAVIDDGLLDVFTFEGRGPARMLLHALRVALRRHVDDPKVGVYRCRRIEVISRRPLPVHVDGDYVGETPAIIEVMPRALNLLVPATAPGGLFSDGAGCDQPRISAVEWMQRFARDVQHAIQDRNSTA